MQIKHKNISCLKEEQVYKDVTEEFVVNVIKTQTKMIAQIHKELLKIFSSSGNDDLITAATFHSELHEATLGLLNLRFITGTVLYRMFLMTDM